VGEGTGFEEPGEVAVFEDARIESLPKILATAASPVYRIGPSRVFDEPQTIQIPVPEGMDANSLEIYYFSESQLHYGWYRARRRCPVHRAPGQPLGVAAAWETGRGRTRGHDARAWGQRNQRELGGADSHARRTILASASTGRDP